MCLIWVSLCIKLRKLSRFSLPTMSDLQLTKAEDHTQHILVLIGLKI